jgi:gliding motility-associated-like protein
MKGVYIPTAFTPNNDRKNDVFRALLFGDAEFFELSIFNRYGEVVYQSKDFRKGWDGKYKGMIQETGVFVGCAHMS